MELLKGIRAIDLSLLLGDTLIVCDMHIGFEEALNKQGMFVPRDHFPQLIKRMEGIFERIAKGNFSKTGTSKANKTKMGNTAREMKNGKGPREGYGKKLRRIIVNGDLKHEFATISDQEWRNTLKFLDFLGRHCEKVILIRGNHDTILGPIAKKRGIEIHDSYFLEDFGALVCHGDKLPPNGLLSSSRLLIIGHEHPTLALRHGKRVEKYKCFYVGSYKGKKLIVLPSLNLLTEGSALMHDDALSPFLRQDTDDFEVFAVEDEVYRFGTLGSLRKNGLA